MTLATQIEVGAERESVCAVNPARTRAASVCRWVNVDHVNLRDAILLRLSTKAGLVL